MQASALVEHRPHTGVVASHLTCFRRQASHASGAGRRRVFGDSTILSLCFRFGQSHDFLSSCVREWDVVTMNHDSPFRHCCAVLTENGDSSSGTSATRRLLCTLPSTTKSRHVADDTTQPLSLHFINAFYHQSNAPLLHHLKTTPSNHVQESNVYRMWYV